MKKIPTELKKVILWQLEAEMPPNFKLCVGNKGTFTKEQLIKSVEKEDEIGIMFAEMQLNFMKDLAKGDITKALAE